MEINLKDVQKWYADKINKEVIELDSYDLFCAKVAYDYAYEQLLIPRVVGRSEQLIDFLLYLNDKGLINNHDFDYEKEAKKYIKKIN